MYKEKLQSQLELLEEVQKKSTNCCEAVEVIELSSRILSIAKEIEEIEKAEEKTINITINGEEIFTKSILQHKQST